MLDVRDKSNGDNRRRKVFMKTEGGPIELDKEIVYKEPEKNNGKKTTKIPWPYFVGATGLILIMALLFINPDNGKFIDSPPPEEQAERDSIFVATGEIAQYLENFDSLPGRADISLPANLIYEKQDSISWAIETETGLYYTSDMDIEAFKLGEI